MPGLASVDTGHDGRALVEAGRVADHGRDLESAVHELEHVAPVVGAEGNDFAVPGAVDGELAAEDR